MIRVCLVILTLTASVTWAEERRENEGVLEVLRGQRDAVLALGPYRLVCESGHFDRQGTQSPPRIGVELMALPDGRFTVHQFRLSHEKDDLRQRAGPALVSSTAWDGNGLYSGGASGVVRFLPRDAFPPALRDPIDVLVGRDIPYFDLVDGFTVRREPQTPYDMAIPVGTLLAFDYLGSLDRFGARQLGRLHLRWCDVVSERLFAVHLRALSMVDADNGNPAVKRVRFTGIPDHPVRRPAAIDVTWTFHDDTVGGSRVFRLHRRSSGSPMQIMSLDIGVGEAAAPGDQGQGNVPQEVEVMTFEYSDSIAGGLLPSSITQWLWASAWVEEDGQSVHKMPGKLRPIKWWRTTKFETLSDAEGRGIIDEYALMQRQIMDITTFPRWKNFAEGADPVPQSSD